MELLFRPLKDRPPSWKGAGATRPHSRFDATHSQTLDLLDREARHLGARSGFLQLELSDPSRGVRIDGQLRADARVVHPGVILTLETRGRGTLVFSCDRFPHWHNNLRAIALGLEALRKVERYGIADQGQQFAGFAELGSGTPMGSGSMSIDEAATLLATAACAHFGDDWCDGDALIADRSLVPGAYRDAVKAHHPDIGGDPDMFRRLTEARDLLGSS